ncbi:putative ribonuclease, partial [Zancudomyces culisetae]
MFAKIYRVKLASRTIPRVTKTTLPIFTHSEVGVGHGVRYGNKNTYTTVHHSGEGNERDEMKKAKEKEVMEFERMIGDLVEAAKREDIGHSYPQVFGGLDGGNNQAVNVTNVDKDVKLVLKRRPWRYRYKRAGDYFLDKQEHTLDEGEEVHQGHEKEIDEKQLHDKKGEEDLKKIRKFKAEIMDPKLVVNMILGLDNSGQLVKERRNNFSKYIRSIRREEEEEFSRELEQIFRRGREVDQENFGKETEAVDIEGDDKQINDESSSMKVEGENGQEGVDKERSANSKSRNMDGNMSGGIGGSIGGNRSGSMGGNIGGKREYSNSSKLRTYKVKNKEKITSESGENNESGKYGGASMRMISLWIDGEKCAVKVIGEIGGKGMRQRGREIKVGESDTSVFFPQVGDLIETRLHLHNQEVVDTGMYTRAGIVTEELEGVNNYKVQFMYPEPVEIRKRDVELIGAGYLTMKSVVRDIAGGRGETKSRMNKHMKSKKDSESRSKSEASEYQEEQEEVDIKITKKDIEKMSSVILVTRINGNIKKHLWKSGLLEKGRNAKLYDWLVSNNYRTISVEGLAAYIANKCKRPKFEKGVVDEKDREPVVVTEGEWIEMKFAAMEFFLRNAIYFRQGEKKRSFLRVGVDIEYELVERHISKEYETVKGWIERREELKKRVGERGQSADEDVDIVGEYMKYAKSKLARYYNSTEYKNYRRELGRYNKHDIVVKGGVDTIVEPDRYHKEFAMINRTLFRYVAYENRGHKKQANPFEKIVYSIVKATGLYQLVDKSIVQEYLSVVDKENGGAIVTEYDYTSRLPSMDSNSLYLSKQAEKQAAALEAELQKGNHKVRGRFSELEEEIRVPFSKDITVYTIDDVSTLDVDDGVSYEPIDSGDGNVEASGWIHVHVADPTRLIEPFDDIFKYAERRVSSVYLPTGTHHMLPESLATKEFSLVSPPSSETDEKPPRPKYAITFSARLSQQTGDIVDYKVQLTTISNIKRLDYNMIDEVLPFDYIPGGKSALDFYKSISLSTGQNDSSNIEKSAKKSKNSTDSTDSTDNTCSGYEHAPTLAQEDVSNLLQLHILARKHFERRISNG